MKLKNFSERRVRHHRARVERINDAGLAARTLTNPELTAAAQALAVRARAGADPDELLEESFALTREAAHRALSMRHYDVQLIGGMVMADGMVSEMRTGEGKTLTATLPAALLALEGKGCHVVTVNEYLARRDCEWMRPVYELLGLTVGCCLQEHDADSKRAAYACDVTYVTNTELGFDYLRDNLAASRQEQVGRGRHAALVDEIDNVLIDEARTPLIISREAAHDPSLYGTFAQLAGRLQRGERPLGPQNKSQALQKLARTQVIHDADYDYEVDERNKHVTLTERGVARAEAALGVEHLYSGDRGHLVNHLHQALKAKELWRRDVDYAVVDGRVEVIDEHTGRILGGRQWTDGLHQAIEAKEGVAVQPEQHTSASVTYQHFFRRYSRLCGMTGTAMTDAAELRAIYKLEVVAVPTHRPVARRDEPDMVFATREGKWSAVVREVAARHAAGQPVLVGTTSVEDSETLSARFTAAGIAHELLNAKPERVAAESETVALAGEPGAVTIATNMAGRGVDIKLGGEPERRAVRELAAAGHSAEDPDYETRLAATRITAAAQVRLDAAQVRDAGGLYVLGTERHDSRRIDNQLRGRSGRQGDPGESRFYVSAEDKLLRLFGGGRFAAVMGALGLRDSAGNELGVESKRLSKQIEKAQQTVEKENFTERKKVVDYDDVVDAQREAVYALRQQLLEDAPLQTPTEQRLRGCAAELVEELTGPGGVDAAKLAANAKRLYGVDIEVSGLGTEPEDAVETVDAELQAAWRARRAQFGDDIADAVERMALRAALDSHWSQHLDDLAYLRHGIGLRGLAQQNPVVAYGNEAGVLFEAMLADVWRQFCSLLLTSTIKTSGPSA